jgi:hypothetical protein
MSDTQPLSDDVLAALVTWEFVDISPATHRNQHVSYPLQARYLTAIQDHHPQPARRFDYQTGRRAPLKLMRVYQKNLTFERDLSTL